MNLPMFDSFLNRNTNKMHSPDVETQVNQNEYDLATFGKRPQLKEFPLSCKLSSFLM